MLLGAGSRVVTGADVPNRDKSELCHCICTGLAIKLTVTGCVNVKAVVGKFSSTFRPGARVMEVVGSFHSVIPQGNPSTTPAVISLVPVHTGAAKSKS